MTAGGTAVTLLDSNGFGHTCATRLDGTLWCWGANGRGQLGDGTTATRTIPTRVGTATTWASVTAGFGDTCAIHFDGALWCWGANGSGQLGDGTIIDQVRPLKIGAATDWTAVELDEFTAGLRS
ncbi:MAG: hypothetical protein WKF43_03910 [Acidimicrobiales bacterium]